MQAQQLSQSMIQNGVPASAVMDMMEANSFTQLKGKIKQAEGQLQQLAAEQQKAEQQMQEAQMQADQQKAALEAEENEKERVVKGMKKNFKSFRSRYGDDAESVMYATATKLAKEELASHVKSGVEAAKPIVRMNVSQNGVITKKEKTKPQPEKKNSKSIFSQLTNKDEID